MLGDGVRAAWPAQLGAGGAAPDRRPGPPLRAARPRPAGRRGTSPTSSCSTRRPSATAPCAPATTCPAGPAACTPTPWASGTSWSTGPRSCATGLHRRGARAGAALGPRHRHGARRVGLGRAPAPESPRSDLTPAAATQPTSARSSTIGRVHRSDQERCLYWPSPWTSICYRRRPADGFRQGLGRGSLQSPSCVRLIVAAWARHMMSAESELRACWVATDGPEVIGVLPFVAEPMARGRMRLLPPTTNMMYGTVPIARADRGREIADAVVEDFAVHSEMVDLASIFWLPEGSPWAAAFQGRLWLDPTGSPLTWPGTPPAPRESTQGLRPGSTSATRKFRKEVQRQGRRAEEQGFRLFTAVDSGEIMKWLPRLQSLYLRRREDRGGEGYEFDDRMVSVIGTALDLSVPESFPGALDSRNATAR